MFKHLNNKRQKGQSTLEYAILIIIIIAALFSIQVYIKRGVQGRLKSEADNIGTQFSPGNTNVVRIKTVTSETTDSFFGGTSRSQLTADEETTEIMNSEIMNVEGEFWGSQEDLNP
jgi:hypothetical protein